MAINGVLLAFMAHGLLISHGDRLGSRGSWVKGRIPRAALLETHPGTSPFGTGGTLFLDPMKPDLKPIVSYSIL